MKKQKELIRFKDEIPCIFEEDDSCLADNDWLEENDCGKNCPGYKPAEIKVCKKHKREYVGICGECDSEYWGKLGCELDRELARERWFIKYLHFTLKYGSFNYLSAWVNNIRPNVRSIYIYHNGKHWRGFEITGFRRGLIFRIYPNGER